MDHNPCLAGTKIIFIDKDFTEIRIISELWPNATYLLCSWHVIKYLRKQVLGMENASRRIKQDTMTLLYNLVHANTEQDYSNIYNTLLKTAPNSFIDYFNANWNNCTEKWASFHRQKLPTMGNNTNNRIEKFEWKNKTLCIT